MLFVKTFFRPGEVTGGPAKEQNQVVLMQLTAQGSLLSGVPIS
jgi:hypothetical protein